MVSKRKIIKLKKDITLNFFKVNASLPLKEWQEKGWIYDKDPAGGFSGIVATI